MLLSLLLSFFALLLTKCLSRYLQLVADKCTAQQMRRNKHIEIPLPQSYMCRVEMLEMKMQRIKSFIRSFTRPRLLVIFI